jgi:hypothetical protein
VYILNHLLRSKGVSHASGLSALRSIKAIVVSYEEPDLVRAQTTAAYVQLFLRANNVASICRFDMCIVGDTCSAADTGWTLQSGGLHALTAVAFVASVRATMIWFFFNYRHHSHHTTFNL